ncbi:MAG: hypothetical protein Q8M07_03300, partial [Prosthecobacter sp.]|nr:hypothetical protein [Prosthecobacter sp.]
NFLLDSQFQIQGLPSLFYAKGQAPAAGHQHGATPEPKPAAAPAAATGHEGHAAPKPAVVPAAAAGHEGHAAPKPVEHKH